MIPGYLDAVFASMAVLVLTQSFQLIAADFLECGTECLSRQGSGTVATVNGSNCQRGNDPFSHTDKES